MHDEAELPTGLDLAGMVSDVATEMAHQVSFMFSLAAELRNEPFADTPASEIALSHNCSEGLKAHICLECIANELRAMHGAVSFIGSHTILSDNDDEQSGADEPVEVEDGAGDSSDPREIAVAPVSDGVDRVAYDKYWSE